MARPGVETLVLENAPPRSAPTATGPVFIVGTSSKGSPEAPVKLTSMSQVEDYVGSRQTYSLVWDWLDTYFREGGRQAHFVRVVGPDPETADITLVDSADDPALIVAAVDPGEFGNGFNVEITAGDQAGEFKIVVTHDDDTDFALTSPSLVDKTAALAWADTLGVREYITLTDAGTSLDPEVAAATGLTGGTDDRLNITNTEWAAALEALPRDLGPGQVVAPGRTTQAGHEQLLDHARTHNRKAVLDAPEGSTKAQLLAASALIRAQTTRRREGALFAPWDTVPGIVSGTDRVVPSSARVCAHIARSEGAGNSPNKPAAGENGIAQFATEVRQTFSDADRQDLNAAGVNISIMKYGQVRTYGWRTLTDPSTDDNWLDFSNARYFMSVIARGEAVLERYLFGELDGRRILVNKAGGDIIALLTEDWAKWNSLYGATPQEAFNVDVGEQVNTPESIANRELNAAVALRMSPFAELVVLQLSKVRSSEAVI
jgi:phage tail sheath protein FI